MKILALDPATKCGWSHTDAVGGVWDLSVKRDESSGMRMIKLRSKLYDLLDAVEIDLVVFEAARHAAPKMQGALVTQAKLQSVIEIWGDDQGIQYRGYSPTEIKKFATGKGNASKAMMIETAQDKWGDIIEDDNHADALWLLALATDQYGPRTRRFGK